METINQYVGWVTAIVATLSLAWKGATWRRSRHKIRVTVSNLLFKDPEGNLVHYIVTRVINTGKDSIAVKGIGIKTGRKGGFGDFELQPGSAPLGIWLGQNGSAEYYILAEVFRVLAKDQNIGFGDMRTWVALSNGSRKVARRPIPLA